MEAARGLSQAQNAFLGETHTVPFLAALGGSVAVGKSTAARLIVRLLASLRPDWRVELVTTDGFLLPNATLIERDILARKGFPESYDRRRLLRFVADLKSGIPEVQAPVYSHLRYDLTDEVQVVRRPDVLVLEGVNVLQRGSGRVYVSDFVDFALYLDADEGDVRRWYLSRFLKLRNGAFQNPDSYFHRYAQLSDEEAVDGGLRHLGAHEPAEPAQQHPADAPARGRDPREGPRPLRLARPAAAGVSEFHPRGDARRITGVGACLLHVWKGTARCRTSVTSCCSRRSSSRAAEARKPPTRPPASRRHCPTPSTRRWWTTARPR